jgi:hypothetical protein
MLSIKKILSSLNVMREVVTPFDPRCFGFSEYEIIKNSWSKLEATMN